VSDTEALTQEVFKDPGTAIFKYQSLGPAMNHNYLCAICRQEKAVLELWRGVLQPCWGCQKNYKVMKLNWVLRLYLKLLDK
jgi:hypothetical protein